MSTESTPYILVVDDEPGIRTTVAEVLEMEGYGVRVAENGAEALKQVDRCLPAVVVLDMRMPVLNGWDFARAVAARGLALPILVITAATDARAWAEEIDAVGYLAKPFDLDDLLDAVERILGRPQGQLSGAY